jgi:hypothetical protein
VLRCGCAVAALWLCCGLAVLRLRGAALRRLMGHVPVPAAVAALHLVTALHMHAAVVPLYCSAGT